MCRALCTPHLRSPQFLGRWRGGSDRSTSPRVSEDRRSHVVDEAGANATIAAIVRAMFGAPWSKARALCEEGRVYVDGRRARDPAMRVQIGMKVEVAPTAEKLRPGVLPREAVLHLDNDVVVVDKPAGTLTVPYEEGDRDTLVDLTRAALRRRDNKTRDPMVGAVQRLDKDTTGVLVFARNMSAKRALEEQLREHTVTRRYVAIVHGVCPSKRHETWLVQDRGDGLRGSWGSMPWHKGARPEDAKRAITHVEPKEALRGATLIECRLETGRQHQIRIHVSEGGNPIAGEQVYVRGFTGPRIDAPRPMLHAIELGFDHPRSGERVTFTTPPPDDFERTLASLRS
jgi:23S rRNA pseudouridine1911/1915/1917 synthase